MDFERIKAEKPKLLRLAFSRARVQQELWEKVERFCRQEGSWLSDYALYLAIKEEQGGRPWQQWPQELRLRYPQALAKARERLREKTEYHSFGAVPVLYPVAEPAGILQPQGRAVDRGHPHLRCAGQL